MNNALLISLIGGGMVFIGLILLWLMMAALVKLTTLKKTIQPTDKQVSETVDRDLECKQKAAIAAVGTVMALLNSTFTVSSHKEKETISPWQSASRSRQINQANNLPLRKSNLP